MALPEDKDSQEDASDELSDLEQSIAPETLSENDSSAKDSGTNDQLSDAEKSINLDELSTGNTKTTPEAQHRAGSRLFSDSLVDNAVESTTAVTRCKAEPSIIFPVVGDAEAELPRLLLDLIKVRKRRQVPVQSSFSRSLGTVKAKLVCHT